MYLAMILLVEVQSLGPLRNRFAICKAVTRRVDATAHSKQLQRAKTSGKSSGRELTNREWHQSLSAIPSVNRLDRKEEVLPERDDHESPDTCFGKQHAEQSRRTASTLAATNVNHS
jgi:hypothetical protein